MYKNVRFSLIQSRRPHKGPRHQCVALKKQGAQTWFTQSGQYHNYKYKRTHTTLRGALAVWHHPRIHGQVSCGDQTTPWATLAVRYYHGGIYMILCGSSDSNNNSHSWVKIGTATNEQYSRCPRGIYTPFRHTHKTPLVATQGTYWGGNQRTCRHVQRAVMMLNVKSDV